MTKPSTLPRLFALALCASQLSAPAAAEENQHTKAILAMVQAMAWPGAAPARGLDWTRIDFVPESGKPGTSPLVLFYPKSAALRQTSQNALFLLKDPQVNGKAGSLKSSLTPYYVIRLIGNDQFHNQVLIGRQGKPGVVIRGVTDDLTPSMAFRDLSGADATAVSAPADISSSPDNPMTAVLDERDPKLNYREAWTYSPLCRDKTVSTTKFGYLDKEEEAPFHARGTHSLFTRMEHIVMTAVAPDASSSLLEHRAGQARLDLDRLAGADRAEFATKTRASLKTLAEDLQRRIQAAPAGEEFLAQESRLLLCYARFMGPGVEQAFYEGLQSVVDAPGDASRARGGFVAFWRPLALELLAKALDESEKVSDGRLVLDTQRHEQADKDLRAGAAAVAKKVAQVKDWAVKAPAPAPPPRSDAPPKDIKLPEDPFGGKDE